MRVLIAAFMAIVARLAPFRMVHVPFLFEVLLRRDREYEFLAAVDADEIQRLPLLHHRFAFHTVDLPLEVPSGGLFPVSHSKGKSRPILGLTSRPLRRDVQCVTEQLYQLTAKTAKARKAAPTHYVPPSSKFSTEDATTCRRTRGLSRTICNDFTKALAAVGDPGVINRP